MGTIWSRISPFIDKRQYAFTTMCVAAGILVLCDFITKNKIDSQLDLQLITGKLSHYSFIQGRRSSKKYDLWLMEYPNAFQIPSGYMNYFNREEFIKHAYPQIEIQLKIPKSRLKDLKERKQVRVLELLIAHTNCLDSNLTIAEENKPTPVYAGFTLIFAGIIFFIFKKKYPYRLGF